MDRFYTKVQLTETQVKHRSRLCSDPCERGTDKARLFQRWLLEALASTHDFQICGSVPFQRMSMYHNEDKWIIELEAVTEEAPSVTST